MTAHIKKEYKPWVEFFAGYTTCYAGFVGSLDELRNLIGLYESYTNTKFVTEGTQSNFGKPFESVRRAVKTVCWRGRKKDVEPAIEFDGIPHVFMGSKVMNCRHGKSYRGHQKINTIEETIQNFGSEKMHRKKKISIKRGCPAKIHIRHIVKFPEYGLYECKETNITPNVTYEIRSAMISDFQSTKPVQTVEQFFLKLPDVSEHQGHDVGENCVAEMPMDVRLKEFIHSEILGGAEYTTSSLKLVLEEYLKHELFGGKPMPSVTNTRFWPSTDQIRRQIQFATFKRKAAMLTEEGDSDNESEWQHHVTSDSIFECLSSTDRDSLSLENVSYRAEYVPLLPVNANHYEDLSRQSMGVHFENFLDNNYKVDGGECVKRQKTIHQESF